MSRPTDRADVSPPPATRAERLTAAAHVFGLWAFAVAQPILDLIGNEPDFLVAHRLGGTLVLALALGLALGMPAMLAAPFAFPAVMGSRVGRLCLDGLRALLAAAFLLQLLDPAPLAETKAAAVAAAVLALGGGTAFVLAVHRWRGFSQLLGMTAAGAVLAPTLFLLQPGVRTLLPGGLPGDEYAPPDEIAAAPAFTSDLPIVLVVFDELPTSSLQRRDGSIDEGRFPAFAALADGSDWYRYAATVGLQTSKAVPALLSGRHPGPEGTANHRDHPNNLFSWLAVAGGYRIVAQETLSLLCPPAVCADETQPGAASRLASAIDDISVVYGHLLLPRALADRLPDVRNTPTGFRDRNRSRREDEPSPRRRRGVLTQDVPRTVDRFLERMAPAENSAPTLYYLHLNLPHRPWKYLPSGREYRPVGALALPYGFDRRRLPEDEWPTVHGLQRHLLQVGYADRVLGQVMDRLRSMGVYDEALIFVTADHGHSFRPGQPRRLPTETNLEDVLEVPLFVKRPGQTRGTIVEHPVQIIDIVPTIAAAVGAQPPWTVDGLELSDDAPRPLLACCFNDGDATRSFRTDPVRRQQTLDRLHLLFGAESRPFEGVFGAGPRGSLLGRAATDFPKARRGPSGAEPPRAILAGAHAWTDVRPDTGFVPSLVNGRIEPGVETGAELAVAVDGIVRATTETFVDRDAASRFSALIDERWLPAGRRRLDLYLIEEGEVVQGGVHEGSGTARRMPVLRPLGDDRPPARLILERGRVRGIELPGEETLRSAEEMFECRLELEDGGFRGWLLEEPWTEPFVVDEFFVFEGERLLYRGQDDRFFRRRTRRRDGREEIRFRISLPSATAARADRLRLLARRGDHVQDLSAPPRPAVYALSRDARGRVTGLVRGSANAVEGELERIDVARFGAGMIGALDGEITDSARVQGWAADLEHPGGGRKVVAFLGDRQLWSGRTGSERPDIASRHGEPHRWTGFALGEGAASRPGAGLDLDPEQVARMRREGVVAYAISRQGSATRLRFSYRPLERGFRRTEILPTSDGRRLIVGLTGGGLNGSVDLVAKREGRTVVEGWAADLERSERARQIVVYRDGEYLTTLGAGRNRPGVAERYGDQKLLRAGYRGAVPGAPDPETFGERHRIFAIMLRGVALELPLPPTATDASASASASERR